MFPYGCVSLSIAKASLHHNVDTKVGLGIHERDVGWGSHSSMRWGKLKVRVENGISRAISSGLHPSLISL